MTTKISYRKQWVRVLIVDFVLLFFVTVFGLAVTMVSEWLPILFCWGMILLFSAIPIILLAMASNNPLPKLDGVSQSLPWGIFGAVVMFVGYALLPSRYSDPTDQMFDLMCFGVGMAGIVFILCYAMKRSSLFLLTGFISPVFWGQLLENDTLTLVFTISSVAIAGVIIIIWNKVDPPQKTSRNDRGGYLRIEDILAETEHLGKDFAAYQDDEFYAEGIDDPDEWMALLAEMARQDDPYNKQFDQFAEDVRGSTTSKAYVWTLLLLLFVFLISLSLILLVLL